MKSPKDYLFRNMSLILLGPLLIVFIILSGSHVVSTYKLIAYSKQKTLWSVVQLDRELTHTQVMVSNYVHDLTTAKSLEQDYNILWSRIPIAMDSLRKDPSLLEIDNHEMGILVENLFNDVKQVEPLIVGQSKIDKTELMEWNRKLHRHEEAIRGNLIHDLASSNSRYARQTTAKILKAATIPAFFIICFFLYLAYLLSALWNERKLNQHLLDHDTMTGLHSRDFIMHKLNDLCDTSTPFILLAFDLNKFKIINDTLGHNAGDELLKHFALQLKNTLGNEGIAGRVGGDEFLWLFEGDSMKLVNHYYGEFLLALKQPCYVDGTHIQASVSAGGILSSNCENNITCILEQADAAMYEAKRERMKTIYWCTQDRRFMVSPPKLNQVPLPA